MRLSIVLAICFLGVASSVIDAKEDANAATEEFINAIASQDQGKITSSFFKVLGQMVFQGRKKRAVNPLELINDIKNPGEFAQDIVGILAELAQTAIKGRKKRDIAEDLQKLAAAGKEKTQQALQKLMEYLSSFKNGGAKEATTVTKRAVNPLELINDIKNPGEFAQDIVGILAELAQTAIKGRKKRDLAEDLKKLAAAGKEKTQEALQKLMAYLSSLKNGGAKEATTVTKRSLGEAFKGFGDAINNFYGMFRKPTKPVAPVAEDTTESS